MGGIWLGAPVHRKSIHWPCPYLADKTTCCSILSDEPDLHLSTPAKEVRERPSLEEEAELHGRKAWARTAPWDVVLCWTEMTAPTVGNTTTSSPTAPNNHPHSGAHPRVKLPDTGPAAPATARAEIACSQETGCSAAEAAGLSSCFLRCWGPAGDTAATFERGHRLSLMRLSYRPSG